jgi:hypothetical protein
MLPNMINTFSYQAFKNLNEQVDAENRIGWRHDLLPATNVFSGYYDRKFYLLEYVGVRENP